MNPESQKIPYHPPQDIPTHTHNGQDSIKLNPAQALTGFPIFKVSSASTAPTDSAQNGTFRFLYDATTFYLWARINNVWKKTQLT